jgi:hypothetical protein
MTRLKQSDNTLQVKVVDRRRVPTMTRLKQSDNTFQVKVVDRRRVPDYDTAETIRQHVTSQRG